MNEPCFLVSLYTLNFVEDWTDWVLKCSNSGNQILSLLRDYFCSLLRAMVTHLYNDFNFYKVCILVNTNSCCMWPHNILFHYLCSQSVTYFLKYLKYIYYMWLDLPVELVARDFPAVWGGLDLFPRQLPNLPKHTVLNMGKIMSLLPTLELVSCSTMGCYILVWVGLRNEVDSWFLQVTLYQSSTAPPPPLIKSSLGYCSIWSCSQVLK